MFTNEPFYFSILLQQSYCLSFKNTFATLNRVNCPMRSIIFVIVVEIPQILAKSLKNIG